MNCIGENQMFSEDQSDNGGMDSESVVIRYEACLSSSTYFRRVIIKSTDPTVTISNDLQRQHQFEETEQKIVSDAKETLSNQPSSRDKSSRSSLERWKHREDRLKRLFDQYSSEGIHREWKPLTFLESRELYQYAFDRYQQTFLPN